MHLESYKMAISCTAISAGTNEFFGFLLYAVSAAVQTDFAVLWEAAVEVLPASLLVTHPVGLTL